MLFENQLHVTNYREATGNNLINAKQYTVPRHEKGRLCRVVVTDFGEFAPAITIRGWGLLGCIVALHICGALRQTFHGNTM